MMLKRMMGMALCLTMLCGTVAPAAAQNVSSSFSRKDLPDFSKPQESNAPSDVVPSTDYALVEIDGEAHVFILERAWVNGSRIDFSYKTYNPRGEVLYTLTAYIPSDMAPGDVVNTRDTETPVRAVYGVTLTYYRDRSGTCIVAPPYGAPEPQILPKGAGLYIEITDRSVDWRSYAGVFSAMLINAYSGEGFALSNGEFHFTLE